MRWACRLTEYLSGGNLFQLAIFSDETKNVSVSLSTNLGMSRTASATQKSGSGHPYYLRRDVTALSEAQVYVVRMRVVVRAPRTQAVLDSSYSKSPLTESPLSCSYVIDAVNCGVVFS